MATLHNIYVDRLPSFINEKPHEPNFQLHMHDRPFLEETIRHEGTFYRVITVVHVQFEPSHIFVTRGV